MERKLEVRESLPVTDFGSAREEQAQHTCTEVDSIELTHVTPAKPTYGSSALPVACKALHCRVVKNRQHEPANPPCKQNSVCGLYQ
jgi:hypothetical protein